MKQTFRVLAFFLPVMIPADLTYPIVDTGQDRCYNAQKQIDAPEPHQRFYGQDAQMQGRSAQYRDHQNGTVSDLVTGLMWSKGVDLKKVSLKEAEAIASTLRLGGYEDWRVPTVKELYSLIDFRGVTGFDPRGRSAVPRNAVPYLNTDYFDFAYGQTDQQERFIDAQWLSATRYVSTTMGGSATLFGVNFADGRIKGYGYSRPGGRREKKFYVRFVRGNPEYGQNQFQDNGDGTVTDRATGLTWMKSDSVKGMTWERALAYARDIRVGGHADWRLPNAKELQSIVDYSRSPDTTDSPALDPVFQATVIRNEAGGKDWGYYWTSTTHLDGPGAYQAVVLCFGRGIGMMFGRILDVHGAGCQRSDPKTGNASIGHGPQGDARRVLNLVRCVRGGDSTLTTEPSQRDAYPLTVRTVQGERRPQNLSSSGGQVNRLPHRPPPHLRR